MKLIPMKAEGKPCHPDAMFIGLSRPAPSHWSDEWYLRQLQLYKDEYGSSVYDTYCSRPSLLKELK